MVQGYWYNLYISVFKSFFTEEVISLDSVCPNLNLRTHTVYSSCYSSSVTVNGVKKSQCVPPGCHLAL